ncbi:MAG: hypothetical protein Q7S51_11415 [Gallionellaceae bacterium]|nr:hypothetical protein [Gallionellaceae bacterium]
MKNTPRSGQNHDVVPLAWGIFNYLDSGLRRNDVISSNGQSGIKVVRHRYGSTDGKGNWTSMSNFSGKKLKTNLLRGMYASAQSLRLLRIAIGERITHKAVIKETTTWLDNEL